MSSFHKATVAAATIACLTPSAVANVLPHMLDAWQSGGTDTSAMTAASFQALSILLMAGSAAVALMKSVSWLLRGVAGVLAVLMFVLNFMNALDASSHRQETAVKAPRETIVKADQLRNEIEDLGKRLKAVPAHKAASVDDLKAAESAVKTAKEAVATQCGDGKRAWALACQNAEKDANQKEEARSTVAANRGLTERADAIQAQIDVKNGDLSALGAIPKYVDSTAAKVLRMMTWAGFSPQEDAISEARPIGQAAGIELAAMFGPTILGLMIGIFFGVEATHACPASTLPSDYLEIMRADEPKTKRLTSLPAAAHQIDAALDAPQETPASVEALTDPQPKQRTKARVPRSPVPRSKPAGKPRKSRVAASADDGREYGDVDAWYDESVQSGAIIERASAEAGAGPCRDAFSSWCEARNLKPLSPKDFGTAMKEKLGSDRIEVRRKYTYYQGFMLRPVLALVRE